MKAIVWVGVLVFVLLAAAVLAAPNNPFCSGNESDSTLGQGAVTICGVDYFCGNDFDGVCPEDFQDPISGLQGSCSHDQNDCGYDIDCTEIVTGRVVQKEDPTVEVGNALVEVDIPGIKVISATTDASGQYTIGIPYGPYFFSASKEGYEPQVKQYTVLDSGTNTLDFELPLGICDDQCQDWEDRCNIQCDGLAFENGEVCTIHSGSVTDQGFTRDFGNQVALACDKKRGGTDVFLAQEDATHAWYVDCCEGTPEIRYTAPSAISSTIHDNIIKYERIVRYNNKPHKLVVVVAE